MEAVLTLPVFILSVIMLLSIIPITGTCENIVFSAADEMRRESVQSAAVRMPFSFAERTENRVREENPEICFYDTDMVRYRYRKNGINDLITLEATAVFQKRSLFNLFGEVRFPFKITGRAFTGTDERMPPLSREEFEKDRKAEPVYVFPESGKRYHKKNCTYVQADCHTVSLNEDIRRKFKPCRKCGAGKAADGTTVYCFPRSGRVYHLENCREVKRHVIEMDREDAEKKGYTPCSKCGGI